MFRLIGWLFGGIFKLIVIALLLGYTYLFLQHGIPPMMKNLDRLPGMYDQYKKDEAQKDITDKLFEEQRKSQESK